MGPVLLFALLTVLNIRRMPVSFSLYTPGAALWPSPARSQ